MKNLPRSSKKNLCTNSSQNIPRLYMRKDVKEWNNTAIDCYNLNSNCKNCFIYNTYFKDKPYTCKMKYYAQLLLEQIGEPPMTYYNPLCETQAC